MVAKSVVLQNLKNHRHVYVAQKYENLQMKTLVGSTHIPPILCYRSPSVIQLLERSNGRKLDKYVRW